MDRLPAWFVGVAWVVCAYYLGVAWLVIRP